MGKKSFITMFKLLTITFQSVATSDLLAAGNLFWVENLAIIDILPQSFWISIVLPGKSGWVIVCAAEIPSMSTKHCQCPTSWDYHIYFCFQNYTSRHLLHCICHRYSQHVVNLAKSNHIPVISSFPTLCNCKKKYTREFYQYCVSEFAAIRLNFFLQKGLEA